MKLSTSLCFILGACYAQLIAPTTEQIESLKQLKEVNLDANIDDRYHST